MLLKSVEHEFDCGSIAKVEGRRIVLYRTRDRKHYKPEHLALLETPYMAQEAFLSCRVGCVGEFIVDCGRI